MLRSFAVILALVASSPAYAKAVRVIQPVELSVTAASQIADVEVSITPATREAFDALEKKAAEKRAEAGLQPIDPTQPLAQRPSEAEYETLPITQMMPLVVQDVTKEKGLGSGRLLKLKIELDTLKTANAGMAMLIGSSDQLAGTVAVFDVETGRKVGEFYVDVFNARSGLFGLAARGSGVREKLAAEFSQHIAKQLLGAAKKRAKA